MVQCRIHIQKYTRSCTLINKEAQCTFDDCEFPFSSPRVLPPWTDVTHFTLLIIHWTLCFHFLIYIAQLNCHCVQAYAEPIGYWKNYYNLFDFAVLVVSVLQMVLTALNLGQKGLTALRVIRGTYIPA